AKEAGNIRLRAFIIIVADFASHPDASTIELCYRLRFHPPFAVVDFIEHGHSPRTENGGPSAAAGRTGRGTFRHAPVACAPDRYAGHHGGAEWSGIGSATDRRVAAGRALRRGQESSISTGRGSAFYDSHQSCDRADRNGHGRGLGGLPVGTRHSRPGAAPYPHPLSRLRYFQCT